MKSYVEIVKFTVADIVTASASPCLPECNQMEEDV